MNPDIHYRDQEIETMPQQRMREIQWNLLQKRLRWLEETSRFYQRKFEDYGLNINKVQNLNDFFKHVPFTTKDELRIERERSKDPYAGLLCVSPDEIVHLIRTGGTTGVPTVFGLTHEDLNHTGEISARMWYQLGAKKGHTVAIGTFGLWNAFSNTLVEGLRTAGIKKYHFSMPVPGEEVFPIEILSRWMSIDGIYLTARPLWQITEKYGHQLKELLPQLKYLFTAGLHVTSSFRKGIEAIWGTRLFEAYAMTDANLPAASCRSQNETLHFPEDAFFVEIIDPNTGEILTGTGTIGEIVVTSLVLTGTPLLRFRSGDMGFTVSEPCACGRTGMRLGLSEREANAVQIGDRLVFSSEVEEILYGIPEFFLKQYHLVRRREGLPQKTLIVRIESQSDPSTEKTLKEHIVSKIRSIIGVNSEVEFLSAGDEKVVTAYKYKRVIEET